MFKNSYTLYFVRRVACDGGVTRTRVAPRYQYLETACCALITVRGS